MKVFTIEIASAVEKTIQEFLKEWGGANKVRFTRFIDLGGKQTDLFICPPDPNASPRIVVRVKSVYKSEEGECMQYFVEVPGTTKSLSDVLVSPEVWKLPALADKILEFSKNELMVLLSEGGEALEEGSSGALPHSSEGDEDEDLDDMDTSGILAGGDDSEGNEDEFDPEAMIRAANESEGGNDDFDPESVIREENEEKDQ